jgi:hypothetical protein
VCSTITLVFLTGLWFGNRILGEEAIRSCKWYVTVSYRTCTRRHDEEDSIPKLHSVKISVFVHIRDFPLEQIIYKTTRLNITHFRKKVASIRTVYLIYYPVRIIGKHLFFTQIQFINIFCV